MTQGKGSRLIPHKIKTVDKAFFLSMAAYNHNLWYSNFLISHNLNRSKLFNNQISHGRVLLIPFLCRTTNTSNLPVRRCKKDITFPVFLDKFPVISRKNL